MKDLKKRVSSGARINFCGGAGVVTGVNYLIEANQEKILVDCGLFQGPKEFEKRNSEPFAYDPKEIEAVIITHSHLDHIGRLPQLIKGGFRGKIFATPATVDFTHLILDDSARVLEEKTKKAGIVPLFSEIDIEEVMKQFVPVEYYIKTKIAENFSFTFYDAGHILGSAIVELVVAGKKDNIKIILSGDIGNPPAPLLRPPDFLSEADYVVVESTYGDRNHEPPQECKDKIENIIEDTIARGGTLLVPSFALERTQQLLYHLNSLIENHRIPRVPVFIDSPLASRVTQVYKKYPQYFNKETTFEIKSGDDIFNFPGLRFTHSSKESKEINNVSPPKIIIAGSGMSQGGRIVHHEVRYLPDPKNTLLLVTYQAEGTLGRKIAEGEKKVEILDQPTEINARIEKISGYSAHADQRFLMNWLGHFNKACYQEVSKEGCFLKKVFIVQGEDKASKVLASLIRDELGVEAKMPAINEACEL